MLRKIDARRARWASFIEHLIDNRLVIVLVVIVAAIFEDIVYQQL